MSSPSIARSFRCLACSHRCRRVPTLLLDPCPQCGGDLRVCETVRKKRGAAHTIRTPHALPTPDHVPGRHVAYRITTLNACNARSVPATIVRVVGTRVLIRLATGGDQLRVVSPASLLL